MDFSNTNISGLDVAVVAAYFLSVIAVGIYVSYKKNNNSVHDFFLGGGRFGWLLVGLSLLVSNVGSDHFIGFAGAGALTGIGVGAWEISGALCLLLLAQIFIPVYFAANITTIPEYLRKRFRRERISVYISVVTLLMYVILKISINIYSATLFLELALGWGRYSSISCLLIITAIVSVSGGLTAIMYIDALQAVIMITGACVLFLECLLTTNIFSLQDFKDAYLNTTLDLVKIEENFNFTTLYKDNLTLLYEKCGSRATNESFKLLRDLGDSTVPWLAWILGCNATSVWYWCTDQLMVQRTLSAKSLSDAQGGAIFASVLKVLPILFMIVPGMLSRIIFPEEVACIPGEHCIAVCGLANGCANFSFPLLIVKILPTGLKGLMTAVMLAALMSDLESIFNSAGTIFTMDIWRKMRPAASQIELVFIGKTIVVLLTISGVLWVPIIEGYGSSQLFLYTQEVTNYLTPPIAAVFLLTTCWNGTSETGAFYSLIIGTLLGIIRLICMFLDHQHYCNLEDNRMYISRIHFLWISSAIFLITVIACWIGVVKFTI